MNVHAQGGLAAALVNEMMGSVGGQNPAQAYGDDRVFDRSHFAMMTADDHDLQTEIIGLFSAQADLWRRLLTPDAPVDTWRDVAHTVKGSARGLGLWALADACDSAEALARAGAMEGRWVTEHLARVRGRLEEALSALSDLSPTEERKAFA